MRKVLVIVGILVVVGLGFWFLSNMTGGVISGVHDEVVIEESFKISDFGDVNEINETGVLNDTQNSTEPKVPYK